MFLLFYSLFVSMFNGSWYMESSLSNVVTGLAPAVNALGKLATSIFGDISYDTFHDDFFSAGPSTIYKLIAFVLALITSIGIVVMAVKGVKKAFGIFFMGIRK